VNIYHIVLLVCASALASAPAAAQDKWHTEFLADASFPTDDFGSIHLNTGVGYEATVSYQFNQYISAYGGWGWHDFSSDGPEIVQKGYVAGMQFTQDMANTRFGIRLRAGVTYEHIELQNNRTQEIMLDSKHGTGFEIGASLSYPFVGDWRITPGIRYRSLTRPFVIDGNQSDSDLNYLALVVSISL